MSFSTDAKKQITAIPINKRCCAIAELSAFIHTAGTIYFESGKVGVRIETENAFTARRIFSIIKFLYNIYTQISVKKNQRLRKTNSYILNITHDMESERILKDTYIFTDGPSGKSLHQNIEPEVVQFDCCKHSYMRAAFLGGGSVSHPEKTYHLELIAHTLEYGESLCELLNYYYLNAKIIERKKNYVVYLKEGEQIITLLNMIGAHNALLQFENVRIYKDMRNKVNRIVNCETANLSKTVNAAVRQIANIEYIKEHMGLDSLSPSLREIAELRLHYTEANLTELGKILTPPVGKSGVNHRLRKIEQIAEELKKEKGD